MDTTTGITRRIRRSWIPAIAAVTALALGAGPASAQVLPPLLGGGDDGGTPEAGDSSGDGTTSAAPPPGGVVEEGESLSGGVPISSSGAHAGAFLRTLGTVADTALEPGTHEITVRAKAPNPSRLVLTVGGKLVAGHNLGSSWTHVRAVVHIPPTGAVVGVAHEVRPDVDAPREIDLDWIHFAPHDPVYTTAGDRILSPDGTPVVYRGMTLPGFEAPNRLADGRLSLPPSFAAEQHAWGLTTVRIQLNQEHWLANCAVDRNGKHTWYRFAVADEVEALTARNIMVMLSLTRTERGEATGCQPATARPPLKEMPDQRSPRFWRSVAERFKDNPLVGFDLYNEPHSVDGTVWRNGGTVTYTTTAWLFTQEKSYQAVGMQKLINVVRSTGADNLVFVSGPRWAANPGAAIRKPINGYGIVMASHTYCHGCSPPQLNSRLDIVTDELGSRYPLIVSETGWADSQSGSYARQFIDWAEGRGLGWTFYAWAHPDAPYSLLGSWVHDPYPVGGGGSTMEPSPAGTPVWNDLAEVRVSRGYDALLRPEG